MKSFNKKYVSLKGLDQNIFELVKNINGKEINECCDAKCCEPTCYVDSTFIYFNSQYEVTSKLKNDVKVQDLFNINKQFLNKQFMFGGSTPADAYIPLYFKEPQIAVMPQHSLMNAPIKCGTECNKQLYDFINSIIKTHKMTYPVVLTKGDGSVQLFFIKGTGTNCKECSIKNSLIEVAALLEELEDLEEVTWAQVLDISIDNLDDAYTFVITCTVDINKF